MKIHDVEQGSPEWFAVRRGIPTASCFDCIITPTGKESTQSDGYANQLLAEIISGVSDEGFRSPDMLRGQELEDSAAQLYAFKTGITLEKIGFCTNDAGTYGCSPDRLVGDDGLLEIKVPKAKNHVKYMLTQKLDQEYMPQIQGQMLVTGRRWTDIISYHPEMPPVIIRVERDTSYQASLTGLLAKFTQVLEAKKKILADRGYL